MGIREAILNHFKEEGHRVGHKEGYTEGFQDGEQKGEVIGEARSIKMVIARAWQKGWPLTEIADLTNKTEEEVQAIIAELNISISEGTEEEE